ncbi:hypothetical protein [Burkholderia cepacia]|uniref:hypothetical protein n=1 Tax=Burkholderia cepacia TaxID=292 RepID=UPI002FE2599C
MTISQAHAGSSGAVFTTRQGLLVKSDIFIGATRLKQQGLWYWGLDGQSAAKFPGVAGFKWSPVSAQLEMEYYGSREFSGLLLDDECNFPAAQRVFEDVLNFLNSVLYADREIRTSENFWLDLCRQAASRLEEVESKGDALLRMALTAPCLNGQQVATAGVLVRRASAFARSREKTMFVRAHGDVHTGNILMSKENDFRLIDPRGIFFGDEMWTSVIYDWGKLLHDLHGRYSMIRAGMFTLACPSERSVEISVLRNDSYSRYSGLLSTFRRWLAESCFDRNEIVGAFLAEGLLIMSLLPFHAGFPRRAAAFAAMGRISLNRWIGWAESGQSTDFLFDELDV